MPNGLSLRRTLRPAASPAPPDGRAPSPRLLRWLPPRRAVEPLAVALVACWALFQNLWRLGAANWMADEPVYSQAGWLYVHGRVTYNLEHPLTAKYLIGLSEALFGGRTAVAMRLPAALASLATAALLWWWARQEAGPWAGLLCGGMWALLPRWVDHDWGPRIDRFAMLDPFLAFFAVCCLYCGWRWTRTAGWRWAIGAGVACALATTSKESGVVIAPVVAVGVLALLRTWRAALQLAVSAATAVVVALSTYLGAGSLKPIAFMLRFQTTHDQHGHPVAVRDMVFEHPPWWANLWFNEQAYGRILSLALAAAVAAAILLRRDTLVVWTAGGLAAFLAFYCLVSGVALPFYYLAWQPEIILLAALGTVEIARRARRATPGITRAAVSVGAAAATVAALACYAVPAVRTTAETARLRPHGIALVPGILARNGVRASSTVLVANFYTWEPGFYLRRVAARMPPTLTGVGAVVVHPPRLRTLQDPRVLALVAVNRSRLRHLRVDALDVYIPTGPLVRPPG